MKRLIITVLFISVTFISSAQVLTNAEEAFSLSSNSGKPIFLVFSGSDWCQQCIHFDKTVLSDSLFLNYQRDHFIVLKADFPQRKKLSPEAVRQNERLAELYNPEGLFPRLIMLRPDKTVITALIYDHQAAGDFVKELGAILPGKNHASRIQEGN